MRKFLIKEMQDSDRVHFTENVIDEDEWTNWDEWTEQLTFQLDACVNAGGDWSIFRNILKDMPKR